MAVRPSVLFLGSAPLDEEPLELTREFEAISEELERSGFAVNSRWHVRASALPKLVDTYAPHVLHFSGHGHDKGLVFEGEHGDGHVADPHAVARVFELLRGRVRCVVLTACSTRAQARLIAKHVDVVIATSKPIYDSTARQFARLFYDHLGRGRSVGESFELAKVGLHLDGDPDHRVLRLVKRPGVSPNEVFLDRAPTLGITSERPATTHRQFEGPPVAHFTGRADELVELEQLLQANRTVCVVATGIGGIGKTTLVAEFARERGRELFPDGIAWIDGNPEQFVGELGRVCRRFGWALDRQPTPVEAKKHLIENLAGRRVLLVVDSLNPAKTPAEHVPIPGDRARTLVTSRTRTLDVELDAEPLELGVWPLETCREYLRSRCERLSNTADDEVDALAEFVGRLPLGIKLLVSVLRHRAGTPVPELFELLRAQPLGTLDQHAPQDRGVAATFRVGYDDLPEPTRQVLKALAVCARQTRRDVVAAVSEVDDAAEQLDVLHRRGFAELASDGAWGMHDVVRMFVLDQPDRETLEQRHTTWVRSHLEAHADPAAHREFAKGVDEARVAFERLATDNFKGSMAIYRPLEHHLTIVGRYQDAMDVSERVLSVAPPNSGEFAEALNNLGLCYRVRGDIRKSIELHERALATTEKLGIAEGQAASLGNLGVCHGALDDYPRAIELLQRSLAIFETLGHVGGQANALGNLGGCYQQMDDARKAIELYERSLSLYEKCGRPDSAGTLGNLGLCYAMLGDIPKAIEMHERSLAINENLGRLEGQAIQLGNLGLCYAKSDDIPKAAELLERSVAIYETLGILEGQANPLANLGLCYAKLDDIPRAISLLERSLAIEKQLGRPDDHPEVADTLRLLAGLR